MIEIDIAVDIQPIEINATVDLVPAIAFDSETIIGAGTDADPYRVDQRIKFYSTAQTGNFTILAGMLYKLVTINSVTDVNVTVVNMIVGSWIAFEITGAGLPVFDVLPTEVLTNRTRIILERLEDDGATLKYRVI